tara:strand:- start:17750 stop:18946 length:1197 start_codon:yes stop_codon:yes gene_type:complete
MSWAVKRVEEIADFTLGKMLDEKKNKGEYLPYLANLNVRWGEFDLSDLRQMRFEQHELERFSVRTGDIVMCEGGEPGRCAIWKDSNAQAMIQKALHRIRPKVGINNSFLYYAFLNLKRTGGFTPYFTGSTIKHLPKQQLAKVEIRIPELSVQEHISSVLEVYDNLIENNGRRIQLLEESARLLYQEWFVHLRFPGHEQVKFTDGVPEGWNTSTIGELSSYLNRGITPKYDDDGEYVVINQKCIRNRVLSFEPARRQIKEYKEEKGVRLGDILINSTGTGTLGRVAQVWDVVEKVCVDTHVTIVRPAKDIPYLWLGYCLLGMERRLEDMGEGATNQKELKRQYVADISVLKPSNALIEMFHDTVLDNTKQIQNLVKTNKSLVQARDLILPKLMSGELTV